jgi:predicted Zn-dependent peptidase
VARGESITAFATVTVGQVNAVMLRYFSPDNFVEVLADAEGEARL